jgi:outer membrane protein OmpA-like peptidoglycan-associated protein
MRRLTYGVGIFVLVAFFLTSCTTVDPYTGEKKTSKTAWGTGIGAVAGAAVGAMTGKDSKSRRRNALIGAGVGGLSGAAVGNYMDRQESKLREKLQGTGVSVTREGDQIKLNMPGNITFETNSADIKSNFYQVLNSVVIVVNEFNKTLINVSGHTDSKGTDAYNQGLSERRASSVGQYLVSQGVNTNRIATMGYGKAKPVADNSTEEGRARNRRVEIELSPLTQQE